MAEFFRVALAYPTLAYSILLGFAVAYWLLAATGLVDHDVDGDAFPDPHDHGAHGVSGIFARLGLGGAPVMLVIALLAFFGWTLTYFVHLFLLQALPGPLRWGLGTLVGLLALVPAVPLSAWALRPFRRLMLRLRPVPQASLLGREGIVVSPEVTAIAGRASVDDGGAGLLLQVRALEGARHPRGARVLLLDHDPVGNTYQVVPAEDTPALGAPHTRHSPEPGDKEIHR